MPTNRRQIAEAGIAILAERRPACFAVLAHERRPLKLGIHREVIEAGVLPAADVAILMRWYVGALPYRRKCIEGAGRGGLDGEPAGIVSAEHAAEQRRQIADRGEPSSAGQ
jgi:ProP effector